MHDSELKERSCRATGVSTPLSTSHDAPHIGHGSELKPKGAVSPQTKAYLIGQASKRVGVSVGHLPV